MFTEMSSFKPTNINKDTLQKHRILTCACMENAHLMFMHTVVHIIMLMYKVML